MNAISLKNIGTMNLRCPEILSVTCEGKFIKSIAKFKDYFKSNPINLINNIAKTRL